MSRYLQLHKFLQTIWCKWRHSTFVKAAVRSALTHTHHSGQLQSCTQALGPWKRARTKQSPCPSCSGRGCPTSRPGWHSARCPSPWLPASPSSQRPSPPRNIFHAARALTATSLKHKRAPFTDGSSPSRYPLCWLLKILLVTWVTYTAKHLS